MRSHLTWILLLALPGSAAQAESVTVKPAPQLKKGRVAPGAVVIPARRPTPRRPPRPTTPALARCTDSVPQLIDRLPFGPGEELGYVIEMAGVYVGRASLSVGERSSFGRHVVYAVNGWASTNSFFNKMSKIDSRQTSMLTPDGVWPLAMFSRAESEQGVRTEDAVFDPAGRAVTATLQLNERDWRGSAHGGQPVQDVVSVVYFARSREVAPGADYCTELYYGKRLWVVRGQVGQPETVSTPAGPYRALPVTGVAVRDGAPAYQRAFKVWISDDEDRLPVRLTSPTAYGEIVVRIDHFKRGRRLVKNAPTVASEQPR